MDHIAIHEDSIALTLPDRDRVLLLIATRFHLGGCGFSPQEKRRCAVFQLFGSLFLRQMLIEMEKMLLKKDKGEKRAKTEDDGFDYIMMGRMIAEDGDPLDGDGPDNPDNFDSFDVDDFDDLDDFD